MAHKEELPPSTVEKLYNLFNNVVDAIKCRGQSNYVAKLQDSSYHHQLNYILQYMAQVVKFGNNFFDKYSSVYSNHVLSMAWCGKSQPS